ncbi:MAG: efflux RND transporter periplasmic adaptor subunit [Prevotella sp.]|nr:efflux RND transporter periplasmic adaptor subunit [uncultured Prevotella sp.]MED9898778.1 efflux RND transporter periplasmic adaptor subunit [Prevotella sp.]
MIKRFILVAALTVITFVGFSFLSQSKAETSESENQEEEIDFQNIPLSEKQVKAVDLKMGEAQEREMDAMLHVNGSLVLRAQDMGNVSSLMGGIVKNVYVKEGQMVSRGQVVATIENTDVVTLQRGYYTAYKESEMARLELDRQKTLASAGAGIKKTLQMSEKNYKVAQANLLGTGRQLQQMGISTKEVAKGKFTTVFPLRAPISGTVSDMQASLGSYADMQTPLMKIRNNHAVECDLNVFEKDIAKVKVGDQVLVSLTNQPGVNVSGRVYGMNQYLNKGTKSVAVHVKLDAKRGAKLFEGMYVSGQIATGRQLCMTLPDKAIVSADGKQYVFALNQQHSKGGTYSFSRHEVTTGVSNNGYTEVALCKHLKKGQKIVTDNAFYLASLTGDHGEED